MEEEKFDLEAFVENEVKSVQVVDLHTHLFPPEHDELFLWGIDELLNYHYIVSEFFMVASSDVTSQAFFAEYTEEKRSDLIWTTLFVLRTPVSEACQGVIRVLSRLGLEKHLKDDTLDSIRAWFHERQKDPREYAKTIFELAGIKYVVMTNIPFVEEEARYWENQVNFDKTLFKSALRVDQLLTADWETFAKVVFKIEDFNKFQKMVVEGYLSKSELLEKILDYLECWARKIDALYLFASTPAKFEYEENAETPSQDMKFNLPRASELIDKVLIPLARKLNLPIGLKVGACRGVNPDLAPCNGGDGVEVVDTKFLQSLCRKFADVKFLVTFLARSNQHEACVLSNKFRNCHLYGCWWFCNNPSIIEEITNMRIEMLGTAFTAQHSDARVIDQLIYKWDHSRNIIGKCLIKRYKELQKVGYFVSKNQVGNSNSMLFPNIVV
mmetsp:Transcript_35457/g.43800  ORF Transcript_35457/g.43800 Transcript_35457/m.43800 type:complete len:440 (+) Transcript_35457:78-1397(+)